MRESRRLRHGYRDLAALLLLVAPFPMLVANSYGGEMVFRIYFFMLPFAAFFAAALVFPSPEAGASPGAPALALLVSVGLLAGLCVAYYGKDRMYHFTANEVAAAEYLNANARAGSLWIDGTWNWPVNYRRYEQHDYDSLVSLPKLAREALAERPVDVVERLADHSTEAYLIITHSQKADVDMSGVLPAGTLDRVEQAMLQARVPVVFANEDATIFAHVWKTECGLGAIPDLDALTQKWSHIVEVRNAVLKHLEELLNIPAQERLKQRYAKFRAYGHFTEKEAGEKAEESKVEG